MKFYITILLLLKYEVYAFYQGIIFLTCNYLHISHVDGIINKRISPSFIEFGAKHDHFIGEICLRDRTTILLTFNSQGIDCKSRTCTSDINNEIYKQYMKR